MEVFIFHLCSAFFSLYYPCGDFIAINVECILHIGFVYLTRISADSVLLKSYL